MRSNIKDLHIRNWDVSGDIVHNKQHGAFNHNTGAVVVRDGTAHHGQAGWSWGPFGLGRYVGASVTSPSPVAFKTGGMNGWGRPGLSFSNRAVRHAQRGALIHVGSTILTASCPRERGVNNDHATAIRNKMAQSLM